ncbi:MAG: tetratricopeptide repeat protein [Rivularia sp. (in: cyanobacteria)]
MQVSKITAMLALGIIAFSSKANANLPSTIELRQESKLQLAQVNLQDAAKYFKSGNKRFEQGDYRGAIADFTQAIQINPNNTQVYYNRGVYRSQLKDYRGAIADYNKAIQINPNYAQAYNNRGVARASLEDKQGTIADFQKAAQLYQQQGKQAEAQKLLNIIAEVKSL